VSIENEQTTDDNINHHGNLRQRTINGLGWRFSAVWIQFISQFGISIVLARLVPPEDFGLVALAMIVIGFGELVTDLGLGPSIIQRKEITKQHVRVAFTLSTVNGGVLAFLVFIAAPSLAQFLQDGRVTPILQMLSIKFIIMGLGIVSQAILTRHLDFRHLLVVDLGSYLLGYGAFAVFLAVQGLGVWSLVYGSILQSILQTTIAYIYVRHSIRPLVRSTEVRDMASFSIGASLERIVNYFALQGDYFIVGRMLGPAPLGLYSRAYTLMRLPLSYFVKVLSRVMFPVASQLQNEHRRSQHAYTLSLSLTSFVVLPTMALIIVLAPEIILGLFGSQWVDAIIPLRILGMFGVFRATYHLAAPFIKAKGQIYQLFWYQLAYGIAVLVGSWLTAPYWGINGVALAVGLAILLMYTLVVSHANKLTGITGYQFLKTQWPGIALSIIVVPITLISHALYTSLGIGYIGVLFLTTTTDFVIIGIALWLLPPGLFGDLPITLIDLIADVAPPRIQRLLRSLATHQNRNIVQ